MRQASLTEQTYWIYAHSAIYNIQDGQALWRHAGYTADIKEAWGGILHTTGLSVHHTGSCDLAVQASGMKCKGAVGNT
jgi:hypothetical protein